MKTPATLLVIEDERQIRLAVGESVRAHGMSMIEAATGAEGVAAAERPDVDLIILDLGLPDIDGLDVCTQIRARSTVPIIVLTARDSESETVALLNAGADDYITKPFGTHELAARVAAQLRRAGNVKSPKVVRSDGLEIDVPARTVTRGDHVIRLTPIEWELLVLLASDPGRVFTHQQLFNGIWKRSYGDARQYLRVHITNLRRKIERDPADPRLVITHPGVGYRFVISP
jgi:two-component system, OmpR family, KDP operon response regulator KdpE